MNIQKRILWVDVAKFLGIFAIYLGHFMDLSGLAYPFVFKYHVPLFFFLSGCMNVSSQEENLWKYIWKKVKTIMIPFWGFSVLSCVIEVILSNAQLYDIKPLIMSVIRGAIRNQCVAGSLWFLTCLFLVEVLFKLLQYLKNKWIILASCVVLNIMAVKLIQPSPIDLPHWWYNADSAVFYILFFALGYVSYPYIAKLFELNTGPKRMIFIITGAITSIYGAFVFFGQDALLLIFGGVDFQTLLVPVIRALLLIWLNMVVAKLLENIQFFSETGRESLYLCGNEFVVKSIFPCLLSVFGLQLEIINPLCAFLYVTVLLVLTKKYIIPAEKNVVAMVKHTWKKELSSTSDSELSTSVR